MPTEKEINYWKTSDIRGSDETKDGDEWISKKTHNKIVKGLKKQITALNYTALQILDEKNRLNKSKELRRNER